MKIKMLSTLFELRIVRYAFYLGCLIFLTSIYFPGEMLYGRELSYFAPHGTFLALLIGLFFVIIDKKFLVYVAFATATLSSLHLKYSTNDDFVYTSVSNNIDEFSTGLLDLSEFNNNYDELHQFLDTTSLDVIVLQELTPNWSQFINKEAYTKYKYSTLLERIDPYGLGFLSRYPFHSIDTIYSADIPTLSVCVALSHDYCIDIINIHTILDNSKASLQKLENQLHGISTYINSKPEATVCIGNFNMVSWDIPIKKFKDEAKLKDGRIGFLPISLVNQMNSEFITPRLNHLFHTLDLNTSSLNNILNPRDGSIIGLQANIQRIPQYKAPTKNKLHPYSFQ